jgi:hypothetical protein
LITSAQGELVERHQMSQFQITKKFTAGLLKGLTHTEITSVLLPLGFTTNTYVVVAATSIEVNA